MVLLGDCQEHVLSRGMPPQKIFEKFLKSLLFEIKVCRLNLFCTWLFFRVIDCPIKVYQSED